MNFSFPKFFIIFFILFQFIGIESLNAQIIEKDKLDSASISILDDDDTGLGHFLKNKLFKKKVKNDTIPIKEENFISNSVLNKPIRKIIIETNDPFGYSLKDSTLKPKNWIEKTGNSIHVKTKPYVIKETLLFKKGDKLDSLKIKESERLLLSQRLLRKVEIKPVLTEDKDSVDVYIDAIDSWTMFLTGSASTSKIGVQIRERNFFGLGHALLTRYRHNYKSGKSLFHFNYTVPNIAKTRVIANVNYFKNEDDHYDKGITFTRPFYSPLAKIAGGVGVGQKFFQDSLDYNRNDLKYLNFKYDYLDVWGAKAFRINEQANGKVSNFILAARYYSRNYTEKPDIDLDPYDFFSHQNNYFLSAGISSRQYVKDNFMFNNGIDEYVEEGYNFGLIGALQNRENYNRTYLAGKVAYGKYLKNKNYIGAELQYGSFFRDNFAEQTTFSFNFVYFSSLMNVNRWKIRQFSKLNYLVGGHRWDTPADELTLNQNDYLGVDGIRRGRSINGDQKLILEFQTQTYSPYEFLGFRLAPFFNAAIGAVSNKNENLFDKDNVVLRLGLGVTFSNDYFIFNNIKFSFSFFPKIPGEGQNIFKTNVIDNRDFDLMNYSFDKPSYIRWNRWD